LGLSAGPDEEPVLQAVSWWTACLLVVASLDIDQSGLAQLKHCRLWGWIPYGAALFSLCGAVFFRGGFGFSRRHDFGLMDEN
jgi:hypothetical protein